MRAAARLIAVAIAVLPRAVAAQADAGAASASDEAARTEAQAAAALRAAQETEARLIELQRQLDALQRERASYDDVRRRLDAIEAQQAKQGTGRGFADWASVPGPQDAILFRQDGFAVRSPNGRFLFRPGVRLQTIYEGRIAGAGPMDTARQDASVFTLAHAELLFEGHAVSRAFEYRLELDFADTATGIVKDAFVQGVLGEYAAVRVGRVRVPYGYQTQLWNGYLELVDVAEATRAFTLDRDVGLMVVGRPFGRRLHYQVAALDGPRTCPPSADLPCDPVDLAYAARIVAAPFGPLPVYEGDEEDHKRPLLQVGVSGAYLLLPTDVRERTAMVAAPLDLDRNGRVDNVSVWQGAAELRAVYRGASLQAEWFGRREHPGANVPDRNTWGAYGQAGYFVVPRHLQVLARVGRTDQPLYGSPALQRALLGTQTTEVSGGISAYLHGHAAKVQVEYTHLSTPDALSAPTVDRIRAGVQLAF